MQPARPIETQAVRRTTEPAAPSPSREEIGSTGATPATIRTWAALNGFEVGTRGRIHATVLDAYAKAHQ
ncbi:Lsr2 family DNA-binding protein [Subtercola boreus]|uniref:Lsr2 family DNA-binding protein n=1 Tax=Subtercola boreus TaxID=120213 RepID=UPI00209BF17F|nr:histone-like nucleoid-structuring protein Lsr2 [Subtercola boreus]